MTDEEAPLDPEESLQLIERERSAATRRLEPDPLQLYLPWGLAWLIGLGMMFLRFGPDERVLVPMPNWLPGITLAAVLVAATIFTTIAGAHATRNIAGPSRTTAAMYGFSWPAAYFTMIVINSRISEHVPDGEVGLLWASSAVGIVAILYLAGAAVFHDTAMFILGLWVLLTNNAGVFAGPGWHSLIVALAGGGGLIVAGFVGHLRHRKGQP